MFIHEDAQFGQLLGITSRQRGVTLAMVEKDYWVTHCLWALHAQGFDVWFKGGTSLSKGFGLIERFSEDLDLKLEPGTVTMLPSLAGNNWTSDNKGPMRERRAHYEALGVVLDVPGVESVQVDPTSAAMKWRGCRIEVRYPGVYVAELDPVLRPFVLLEIGRARVAPSVPRDLSSFVHDELARQDQLGKYTDNRPLAVRCVHPLVTLLEKLDALQKRVLGSRSPASFVRHFEDALRIVEAAKRGELPGLTEYPSVRSLAEALLHDGDVMKLPSADDPAFAPNDEPQWDAIRDAHRAIGPMFWGGREPLEACCAGIRRWLLDELT
ncbi:MAG: hypothetical protein RLZZ450_6645 [Pseudomonadota bacterium]|jgi:hypothetical protein